MTNPQVGPPSCLQLREQHITHDGEVCQFEALMRWRHPSLGFVPPDEFIGLAERSGNIRKLSQWMLEHITSQLQQWQQQGSRISVAVNLLRLIGGSWGAVVRVLYRNVCGVPERLFREYGMPSQHISYLCRYRDASTILIK